MLKKEKYDLVCTNDYCEYGIKGDHGLLADELDTKCPKCGRPMILRDIRKRQ